MGKVLFHAGAAARPSRPLKAKDLESFADRFERTTDLRRALSTLLPHLRDEIVEVDSVSKAFEPGSARVTVYAHPNTDGEACYVLVSRKGTVIVGRGDNLKSTSEIQLSDFSSARDEILSVTTTRQGRFFGNTVDLFIVARSLGKSAEETRRVYHGLIDFDDGLKPKLRLPRDDDRLDQSPRGWAPMKIDEGRFPGLLRQSRIQVSHAVDPFAAECNGTEKKLRSLADEGHGSLAAAAETCVGIYPNGVFRAAIGSEAQIREGRFGADITFCAISDHDPESEPGAFGLLGFESHRLVAFDLRSDAEGDVKQAWRHYLSEFPSCAVFLPKPAAHDPDQWPEFLVAFRDGSLARFRYVGRKSIYGRWRELWDRYDQRHGETRLRRAMTLSDLNAFASRSPESEEALRWQQASLFVAVEEALERVLSAPEEENLVTLRHEVAELFKPNEDYRALAVPLQPLFQALRQEVIRESGPRKVITRFILELLAEIYERQDKANIEILNHIDRVIGSLDDDTWRSLPKGEKVERLRKKCRVNRQAQRVRWGDITDLSDEEAVQRASSAIERWASAFLPSDALHIGRWKKKTELHGAVGFQDGDDESWVAVCSQEGLSIHQQDKLDRLTLDPVTEQEEERHKWVMAVPGRPGLLLNLNQQGDLRLLGLRTGGVLTELASISLEDLGAPGAWAVVPVSQDSAIGVVTCHQGHRCVWVFFCIEEDKIRRLSQHTAEIPGVSCVDLATKGKQGLLLIAGSSLGGPVQVYEASWQINRRTGEIQVNEGRVFLEGFNFKDNYWPSAGGTSSVRFVQARDPRRFIIGDVNGFLWCGRLELAPSGSRLAWVYQLDAAIRSILPLAHEGENHVLVGSDAGKLALLRCSDAHRVWTHRLQSPVVELAFAHCKRQSVIATLRGGWFCIFEKVGDRKIAWNEGVEPALDDLPMFEENGDLLQLPATKIAQAIHGLRSGAKPRTVLEGLKRREHRARALRYLAENLTAEGMERIRELLGDLTNRELQILLCFLPLDLKGLESSIHQELLSRTSDGPAKDDSLRAAWNAWVCFLHRLERQEVSLEDFIEHAPRAAEWHESPWVSLETARIFLLLTGRQVQRKLNLKAVDQDHLFAFALPYLFHFPVHFLDSCSDVLPNNSEDKECNFKCLRGITQNLQNDHRLLLDDMGQLADVLEESASASRLVQVVRDLFFLFHDWAELQDGKKGEWNDYRLDILRVLGRLTESIQSIQPSEGIDEFAKDAIQRLHDFLPPRSLPGEMATQASREQWLKGALDVLLEQGGGFESRGVSTWSPIFRSVIKRLWSAIRFVIDRELEFILNETRPFLKLAKPVERLPGDEVILELEIRPEGRRILEDVSIVIDAEGKHGFSASQQEETQVRLYYPLFRPGDQPEQVTLRGFVLRQARKLQLTVDLAASKYWHRQLWEFALPSVADSARPQYLEPFSRVKEALLKELGDSRERVIILVADEILGRDLLIQDWRQSTKGRQVDLDSQFQQFGENSKYKAQEIDFEFLQEILNLESFPDQPVIVGPTDQTFKRWFEGEAPDFFDNFIPWLRAYPDDPSPPQMIWVVSSEHEARLRRWELSRLKILRAHRPHLEGVITFDAHGLQQTEYWQQLIELGAHLAFGDGKTASRNQTWRIYQRLGGDLFFVANWWLWLSRLPLRSTRNFDDFFSTEQFQRRIQAELESLHGLDLLVALVGANTVTTFKLNEVEPGLVSTEELRSTTLRNNPSKVIVKPNQPFDHRSIYSLKADAAPPNLVRVQGYGLKGTPAAENRRTKLVQLVAKWRGRKDLEVSFQRLALLGIGTWQQSVFRTSEPYRTIIRAKYDAHLGDPVEVRDSLVYQDLLGEGRSPLETIVLTDMADPQVKETEILMPGLSNDERKLIRRLAKLWRQDEADLTDLLPVYQAIFEPQRSVWYPQAGDGRWDCPLLDLEVRCLGVGVSVDEGPGQKYPVGYHYWLNEDSVLTSKILIEATEKAVSRRRRQISSPDELDLYRKGGFYPRIVITGPGSEEIPPDRNHRYALLKSTDFLQAAWEGQLDRTLLRRARSQMRMVSISPFQTSGPLPPGSLYFFGRQEEREFIETRLPGKNFLIIGSRRVGKTSLLNQIRYQAATDPRIEAIYIDVQGQTTQEEFDSALRSYFLSLDPSSDLKGFWQDNESFDLVAQRLRRSIGRFPVFLFNEIDGLAEFSPKTIADWRRAAEAGNAGFVMTAYATVAKLGNPRSPFFNWTVGPEYNGQAMTLTQLNPDAAAELLGMLEGDELGLIWRDEGIKSKATKLLLERSYRIPWVLQVFGQRLVERMETERRGKIEMRDVEFVLKEQGDIVWRYFQDIDYRSLGPDLGHQALRPGFQLVLFCLARSRYFARPKPLVHDLNFHRLSPLEPNLGFTIAQAREVVKKTLEELLSDEREIVEEWFDKLDLEKALPLLTLTLMLQADPSRPNRFGFLMHILPRELHRKYGEKDPHLDNLIVETAVEFWTLLQ